MASKHLVVIGGGAAGFFCAVNAARLSRGLTVTLVEKSSKLLSKVRISGGGRCNVTHACFDIAKMGKQYPRGNNFVKKSFHQFFTGDTISWFQERGVKLKTEPDGRMFPITDSSQTIVECLVKEANLYGVNIRLNRPVSKIHIQRPTFNLQCADGENINADYVCVGTGGYPRSSMFEWLMETGHTIEEPVPSLFTFNLPDHRIRELMGLSVNDVRIKIAGTKLEQQGPVLITHWGLSGPAILRLSAWGAKELAGKNYEFSARLNWLHNAGYSEARLRTELMNARNVYPAHKISSHNFGGLPQRLWQFLLSESNVDKDVRFGDLPKKSENSLVKNLVDYTVNVKGKTTFKEEFVTAGGIKLSEVDPNTMMSKKVPNLYFAGETLDVDGLTGGFNFQHAWTSGFIAASSIAKR